MSLRQSMYTGLAQPEVKTKGFAHYVFIRMVMHGDISSYALGIFTDISRWEFREPRPEDERIRATRESSSMGSGAAAPMAIKFEGHLRQIQDFIDGIRERRPFLVEGHEARKAVALVRAMYDSAASGKPVRPA